MRVAGFAFLVAVLVAVGMCSVMIPVVLDTSNSSALNLTGGAAAMVDLIPTFFFVLLLVGCVAGVMMAVRR